MDVPSVSGDEHQDDDGDKIVTMVDVLNEETELEEHANAVLGGADDKICTYSKVVFTSWGFPIGSINITMVFVAVNDGSDDR